MNQEIEELNEVNNNLIKELSESKIEIEKIKSESEEHYKN